MYGFPSKKTGEILYQITTKPKKQFNILGISFSVSEWSPAMATTSDVTTSGFANDISKTDWEELNKAFPDGKFYMDINSDINNPTILSEEKYKEHLASSSTSSPSSSYLIIS